MNELLFCLTIIICFSVTILFYKFLGKTGLLIWVALATIICNIETVKLVNIFGVESALGTVLYASSFLTTDILNEKYGKKYAIKALYVGFCSMILMTMLIGIALAFKPSASDFASESLELIFSLNVRITIASLLGFATSQFIDTNLYSYLKGKSKHLWLRNNISTMVSQLADTMIFVFITYYKTVDIKTLISIMITMYIFKFIIAILDTPFMYIAKRIKKVSEV